MMAKPSRKPRVARVRLAGVMSGISSLITTVIIAPAAKAKVNGKIFRTAMVRK